ncbi:hypothetical protein KHQ81_12985 [Mycoplasmatota bacterium]|nr:hypothetical protein KHQ81_12985 [Mycoplasmatota bacterium]
MSIVEQPVKLECIHKGGVYVYKETFKNKTSKAIVKVRKIESDEYEHAFVVSVIEVQQGHFPKNTFRIVIHTRVKSPIEQNFYQLVGY